jgi:hypothetical protein
MNICKLFPTAIIPCETIEVYHFEDHLNIVASILKSYDELTGKFEDQRYFLAQVKKMPPSTAAIEKPLFDHLFGEPVFSTEAGLITVKIFETKTSYFAIKRHAGCYEQSAGCYSKEFSFYQIVDFVTGKAY